MAWPTSFVEFTGAAKLDRRTKNLVRRLGPDDVAVIDHTDLDRVSAEELLESGVRVVVNVAPSHSGRFPNPGPLLLLDANEARHWALRPAALDRLAQAGLARTLAPRSLVHDASGRVGRVSRDPGPTLFG